jgi:hypothetical protein
MKKFIGVGLLIAASVVLTGCAPARAGVGTDTGASRTPTAQPGAVQCVDGEADYTTSNTRNTLAGVCKKVVISGHNISLTAADIKDLTVSGDTNAVDVAVLGGATVVGNTNTLKTTTVGPLTVSGNGNTVTALGPIGAVVVTGANDTITTPVGVGSITQSGIGNKIGAP